jgi:hypothetical protein
MLVVADTSPLNYLIIIHYRNTTDHYVTCMSLRRASQDEPVAAHWLALCHFCQ